MLTIAVCDDEREAAKELRREIEKCLQNKDIDVELIVYTKSSNLLFDVQEGKRIDILFSDIEMPERDGMRLIPKVREYMPDILVIFVTNHLRYAIDAYELDVFRYIPKAEIGRRLPGTLDDALRLLHLQAEKYYILEQGKKWNKIPYSKILFLKKEGKYVIFYLSGDKQISVRSSLEKVYQTLTAEDFIYIDRGCVVNLAHIEGIKGEQVYMDDGIGLTVSYARMNPVKHCIHEFWRRHI